MANKIAFWVNRFVTVFGWLVLLLFFTSVIKGDFDTVYNVTKILIENAIDVFLSVWNVISSFVSGIFSRITA